MTEMTMRKWVASSIFLVVAMAALLVTSNQHFLRFPMDLGSPAASNDPPIGTVNGETLYLSDFQTSIGIRMAAARVNNQEPGPIDYPELLGRIVLDKILLQAAQDAGTTVDAETLETEVANILMQIGTTREAYLEALNQELVTWADFEESVNNYITISQYIYLDLLISIPPDQQASFFDLWLMELYQNADLDFEQEFLDAIGAQLPDS
jgi:parvulin-like peptidyl-prolyl isomerase